MCWSQIGDHSAGERCLAGVDCVVPDSDQAWLCGLHLAGVE